MAFSKFIIPKKKRRVNVNRDSPYPVPLETDKGTGSWFYYTGFICNNHVQVKHTGDIERLYKMGFFGKGALSRSKPEFNQKYRTVEVPNKKGQMITARVMSRRNYLHRLKWKTDHKEEGPNFSDYDSSEEMLDEMDTSQERINDMFKPLAKESQCEKQSETTWLDNSYMGEVKDTGSCDELWEEDAEFWGMDSLSEQDKDNNQSNDTWNNEPVKEANDLDHVESRSGTIATNLPICNDKVKIEDCSDLDSNKHKEDILFDKKDKISSHGNTNSSDENVGKCDNNMKKDFSTQAKDDICIKNENIVDRNVSSICLENSVCMSDKGDFSTGESDKGDNSVVNSEKSGNFKMENSEKLLGSVSGIVNEDALQIEKNQENFNFQSRNDNSSILETGSDVDSLCKSDDEDGNVFVVDDSDSESEYTSKSRRKRRKRKKWKPVLKRNPLFIKENLHLSLEEAFFLSYALACMVVKDESQINQDLTQLWRLFSNRQQSFIPNYVAYHYYRSKGWVPKTGLKFGSDLLIYKEGPAFYHGSYSVIVKMVMEDTLEDDKAFSGRDLSWTSLAGLNRLTEQVAKELLICYVIRPRNLTDEDLMSPKCISQFKVKEMILSRWVSSQEREKRSEDMP